MQTTVAIDVNVILAIRLWLENTVALSWWVTLSACGFHFVVPCSVQIHAGAMVAHCYTCTPEVYEWHSYAPVHTQ